jgi:thiosulfate/3-mercaptopyruvate sulfurtransferase
MFRTLISVEDLSNHLDHSDWVVCDCRHDLTNYEAGRSAYSRAHIPASRFVHLDEDLSGPKTGTNGRHPLPHPRTLALRMGALGIANGTQVVAYDASGGYYAARLWWMMRWIGHDRVAVLDGGWEAWIAAGLPVTAEWPAFRPTAYTPRLRPELSVDAAHVGAHADDDALIDARSPDRFAGQNEHLDPVAGHIPGAINRFFKHNLVANGRFKSPTILRQEFEALLGEKPPTRVVHQCGSGVTACHNLLAMEHAGLVGSRLYAGSWSEWVSDPSRPVAR